MIDKANAVSTVMSRAAKLTVGSGMDLRTYKRDRSVIITRVSEDLYEVMEDGFEKNWFEVDGKGLKKLLKTLLKREFPRSNKIRVYDIPAGA